jgi:hypothetical protein
MKSGDPEFLDSVGVYPLPIRYILVPHTGQAPCVAGRPFFRVTCCGLRISRLVRHLRQ